MKNNLKIDNTAIIRNQREEQKMTEEVRKAFQKLQDLILPFEKWNSTLGNLNKTCYENFIKEHYLIHGIDRSD